MSAGSGASACELTAPVGHTFLKSPVFVQHLQEGTQTFATGLCLPCRIDQRYACRTAKISCPSKPGAPVVEHIWLESDQCEGKPTRTAAVPSGFITCPGPDHHSPQELNLTRFVKKLLRDHKTEIKTEAEAEDAIAEYRRMLTLVQTDQTRAVVPSRAVDLVWHEHILDTAQYRRDSLRMFGRYLDHAPSFGGSEEKLELRDQQVLPAHCLVVYSCMCAVCHQCN
jgi:hypothetical protein